MKKLGSILFVVAAIFTSGCSTTIQGVSDDFTFASSPDEGLYAFSFRWDRRCEKNIPLLPVSASMYVLNKAAKASDMVPVENPFITDDFKNPPGFFYVKKGKPGNYVMEKITLTMDHKTYRLRFNKPISFNVQKGKLKYLGELSVKAEKCRPKIVRNIELHVGDTTVTIKNQWQRDKKLLAKRLKNLAAMPVKIHLMKQ